MSIRVHQLLMRIVYPLGMLGGFLSLPLTFWFVARVVGLLAPGQEEAARVAAMVVTLVLFFPSAAEQLLPLIYDELRKLAASNLAQEKPGQTPQATALVHEAYLRLVGCGQKQSWSSRGHFFGAAAEAMRRILIGHARRKASIKAGWLRQRVDLSDVEPEIQGPQLDLIALDAAIEQLADRDSRAAALVKLRFFAGLMMPRAAEALGIPLRNAERNWTYAKTWLHRDFPKGYQQQTAPESLFEREGEAPTEPSRSREYRGSAGASASRVRASGDRF